MKGIPIVTSAIQREVELPPFAGLTPSRSVQISQPFGSNVEFWVGRCAARVGDAPGSNTVPPGFICGGSAGFNPERVRDEAFGELVERSSAFVSGRLLPDIKTKCLGRSSNWYKMKRGTLQWPNARHKCVWVPGINLKAGLVANIPAQLAYMYWLPTTPKESFFRSTACGLAAGLCDDAAIMTGLLEVLERDAAILSWLLPCWTVRPINLATQLGNIQRRTALAGFDIVAFEIGIDPFPPVVLVQAFDVEKNRVTVSSSCKLLLNNALEKAISEALALHEAMRLIDRTGKVSPGTWVEHAFTGYSNARKIRAHYENRPHASLRRQIRTNWNLQDLARAVSTEYGSPAFAADVSDRRHKQCVWKVWRTIVPAALSPQPTRENTYAKSHRVISLMQRKQFAKATINGDPHPFA